MTIEYNAQGVVPTNQGVVTEPVNVSPADAEANVNVFPLLTASAYAVTGGDNPEEWGRFQLFYDVGLTNLAYESGLVPTSSEHRVTKALLPLTTYYYRTSRKGAQANITPFSQVTSFTTGLSLADFVGINHETGNGVELSVINGIDLSNNEGSVLMANRDDTAQGRVFQTRTGLKSGNAFAATIPAVEAEGLQSFDTDGVTVGNLVNVNGLSDVISTFVFRDRAGFHDTVLYTGNGSADRDISHALGVLGGMVIFKRLETFQSSFSDYWYKHKDVGSNTIRLASNSGTSSSGSTGMTDTTFNVGSATTNGSGEDMVAEIFAHNPEAGVFCGTYTGDAGMLKLVTGFPVGVLLLFTTGGMFVLDIKKGGEDLLFLDDTQSYSVAGSDNAFESDGIIVGGSININAQVYYYVAIADPEQF